MAPKDSHENTILSLCIICLKMCLLKKKHRLLSVVDSFCTNLPGEREGQLIHEEEITSVNWALFIVCSCMWHPPGGAQASHRQLSTLRLPHSWSREGPSVGPAASIHGRHLGLRQRVMLRGRGWHRGQRQLCRGQELGLRRQDSEALLL